MENAGSSSGKPDDPLLSREERLARIRERKRLREKEFARKLTPAERRRLEEVERILRLQEELERKPTPSDPHKRLAPEEILARGPEALQAYNEALKSGQTKNQRVLVTVVGPARAGKTSLLRSLKGEKFNPNQDSTIGAHLQASFCKPQENSWCEDQTGKYSFTSSLVKITAKNLHTRTREEHLAAASYLLSTLNLKEERDSRQKDLEGRTSQESKEENETVQTTDVNVTVSKIPDEHMRGLLNCLKGDKNDDRADENSIFLKTFDFAGQQVYEVLLPLFMSSKAIYILVYNLENDLDKHAQFKVKHGNSERELENHLEMTNLETLEFWLSCISSYTKKGGECVGDRIPVALPPVFVVCTHADKCKKDPKRLRVAETLVKHLTRPENSCGKHVMGNVYTVDNKLSGHNKKKDKSVKRLKTDIEELSKYLPQMDECIPLNWLKFEEELSNVLEYKQKKYIDFEEARRIAKKCNINTATESNEFATLLNYLHDLKSIIYFEGTRKVFIDTQWLMNMFVKVITVMPVQEWTGYADYWRKLENEGVLQRALVEHVWKDIADDGQNTVDSLLLIMEKFSLICRWRLDDEEVFLVPCMLCNSETSKDIEKLLLDPKSSTMVIHFKGVHLPLGIFPRLVVAVAEHAKKEWPKVNQPKLRPNFCRIFKVGEKGMLDICITSGIRIICVSVCNKNNLADESVTQFCQTVRKLLAQIFDHMRRNLPSMENTEFEYGIRCPVCTNSKKKCKSHKMEGCTRDSCLHFVSEEELKDDRPECYEDYTNPDNLIKEETYGHWFPQKTAATASEGPDHSDTSRGPSGSVKLPTSFNLSDNKKRWIVVGICLNKTLLPDLRDFLAQEMIKHYAHLKTKRNIDKQNLSRRLKKDGRYSLNYSSINNNEGKEETNFDFDVKSEVDLGKLYLKPYMAKFTGFDDTCDLSAGLGILSSASVFSSKIRDLASKVRQDLRNEWGHCNFLTWDEAKFTSSFQLMASLIRKLKLPSDKEKRITDELKDWEARGMDLCRGNIMDADGLLKFIQYGEIEIKRLSQEVERLGKIQEEGTKQIAEALLSNREDFNKDKEEIYETVEAYKRKIEELEIAFNTEKEKNLKKMEAPEGTVETLKVNTVKPTDQEAASSGPSDIPGSHNGSQGFSHRLITLSHLRGNCKIL